MYTYLWFWIPDLSGTALLGQEASPHGQLTDVPLIESSVHFPDRISVHQLYEAFVFSLAGLKSPSG